MRPLARLAARLVRVARVIESQTEQSFRTDWRWPEPRTGSSYKDGFADGLRHGARMVRQENQHD